MNQSPGDSPRPSRRDFLRTTIRASAAGIAFPAIVPGSALGLSGTVAPSNRIAVGVIGTGNQGFNDIKSFLATSGCRSSPYATSTARAPATGRARSAAGSRPGGWSRSTTPRAPRRDLPRLRRLRRLPRDPRPGRHRRRRGLHAGPLARDPGHRGLQGRQGHLLPEAALADGRRRPRHELRGKPVQASSSRPAASSAPTSGSAAPANWSATAGSATCAGARRPARRAGPTTPRPATARSRSRSRRASSTTSGSARLPMRRTPPRDATSTSDGSTTTPAARSPTGAATIPTAPSGAWAPR